MSEQIKIKVATYNVGDYSGRDDATAGSDTSRELFTKVFTDLIELGEKKVLNKKYLKQVYNEIVLNQK